jgi:hypothetical protein
MDLGIEDSHRVERAMGRVRHDFRRVEEPGLCEEMPALRTPIDEVREEAGWRGLRRGHRRSAAPCLCSRRWQPVRRTTSGRGQTHRVCIILCVLRSLSRFHAQLIEVILGSDVFSGYEHQQL